MSRIQIPERKREADETKVASLESSMRVEGLLQPIGVLSSTSDDSYTLVYGLHRLLAAKNLSWNSIQCLVLSTDKLVQDARERATSAGADESETNLITEDIMAELAEIDENLIRYELSVPEFDAHNKRRKEIYETLYPESTKVAKSRANGRLGGRGKRSEKPKDNKAPSVSTPSYVADTVAKTGRSKSSVNKSLARAGVPNLESVPETVTVVERDEVAAIHGKGVRAEKEAKRKVKEAEKVRDAAVAERILSEAKELEVKAKEIKEVAQEKIKDLKTKGPKERKPKSPTPEVPSEVDALKLEEQAAIVEGLLDRIQSFTGSAPYATLKELERKLLEICRGLTVAN